MLFFCSLTAFKLYSDHNLQHQWIIMTEKHSLFPNGIRYFPDRRKTVARQFSITAMMLLMLISIISACTTQSSVVVVKSENQDTRVRVVVMHFTTADFQDSLNILTRDSSRPVSSPLPYTGARRRQLHCQEPEAVLPCQRRGPGLACRLQLLGRENLTQ